MQKNLRQAVLVCAGCTLMLLVTGGLAVNVYSAAQPYILAQNGFTNTQTSLIITIRSAVYLLCMLFVTQYYRLVGYRFGCASACLLAGVSFAMFAAAKSLAAYYAAGVVAGLCYGLGSMVPASILISRWFRSHRGLALGICAAGTGLATVVFSPLLTRLIEARGLSEAFWWTAAFCMLCGAASFFLVRSSPERCGLTPFGEEPPQTPQARALRETHLRRPRWIVLVAAVTLLCGITSTGFTHMMTLYVTAGMDAGRTALALSVSGLSLMAGKCVCGELCDLLGSKRANYLMFAILIAGCALCVLAPGKNAAVMFLAAGLFGFGASINSVGVSIWAADFSSPATYGKLLQLFQGAFGLGNLLLSFVPGAIADLAGGYAPAYALYTVLLVGCLIVIQDTYRLTKR